MSGVAGDKTGSSRHGSGSCQLSAVSYQPCAESSGRVSRVEQLRVERRKPRQVMVPTGRSMCAKSRTCAQSRLARHPWKHAFLLVAGSRHRQPMYSNCTGRRGLLGGESECLRPPGYLPSSRSGFCLTSGQTGRWGTFRATPKKSRKPIDFSQLSAINQARKLRVAPALQVHARFGHGQGGRSPLHSGALPRLAAACYRPPDLLCQ